MGLAVLCNSNLLETEKNHSPLFWLYVGLIGDCLPLAKQTFDSRANRQCTAYSSEIVLDVLIVSEKQKAIIYN